MSCTCPVCLEEVESPNDEYTCIKCNQIMHSGCQARAYEQLESCPMCRWSWSTASSEQCTDLMRAESLTKNDIRRNITTSLAKCMNLADAAANGCFQEMIQLLKDRELICQTPVWVETWKWLEADGDLKLDTIREKSEKMVECCYEHAKEYVDEKTQCMNNTNSSEEQRVEAVLSLLCAWNKIDEIVNNAIKDSNPVTEVTFVLMVNERTGEYRLEVV